MVLLEDMVAVDSMPEASILQRDISLFNTGPCFDDWDKIKEELHQFQVAQEKMIWKN
jgi:hypothetical protein